MVHYTRREIVSTQADIGWIATAPDHTTTSNVNKVAYQPEDKSHKLYQFEDNWVQL